MMYAANGITTANMDHSAWPFWGLFKPPTQSKPPQEYLKHCASCSYFPKHLRRHSKQTPVWQLPSTKTNSWEGGVRALRFSISGPAGAWNSVWPKARQPGAFERFPVSPKPHFLTQIAVLMRLMEASFPSVQKAAVSFDRGS